jgi:hypothetical protein
MIIRCVERRAFRGKETVVGVMIVENRRAVSQCKNLLFIPGGESFIENRTCGRLQQYVSSIDQEGIISSARSHKFFESRPSFTASERDHHPAKFAAIFCSVDIDPSIHSPG